MKRFLSILILSAVCVAGFAQSRSFKLGKWAEINAAILRELNASYVDSLPVDRIGRASVDAMLAELDPYTIYVAEEEKEDFSTMINKTYGGIGAVIYKPDTDGPVIVNEPYANSPAARGGLRSGDEILEIDGETVVGLNSQQSSEKMRGDPGTKVVFKVRKVRTGEIKEVRVTREAIHLPDIEYAGFIRPGVGYILQSGFTEGVAAALRKEILNLRKTAQLDTLVLDLRGNGGGLLAEAIDEVGLFVPKGSLVVTAKGREEGSSYTCRTSVNPVDTALPLVVLVDGSSASASEIVAGALQDLDRAVVAGTRTFGKGLVQSIRRLPHGGQLKITTAKYYTPSGRCVQAIDYSHRAEDGSVGHIPDSLTREFKTASGRTVRDGGGITPDITVEPQPFSRLAYSLVVNGVIEQFALDFVRRNDSVAPAGEFALPDSEYENFIKFAEGKSFDYRSSARAYFDVLCKELSKDGLEEALSEQTAALGKALDMDKETFLRIKKDEIVPLIEEEIVVRYQYQAAGVKQRLKTDTQLFKILSKTSSFCFKPADGQE